MNILRALPAVFLLAGAAYDASAQEVPTPPPPDSAPVMVLPAIGGAGQMLPLLRRADVQGAIRLTVNQKNELADLIGDSATRVKVSIESKSGDDEASRRRQVEEQVAAQFKGIDDRIRAALKPEQYDRLTQISLQWKGPMSLSDSSLADRLNISRAHHAEIKKIASDYQIEKSKIMLSLAQQQTDSSPDGSKRMVMMRVNTQELENPLSPAYKKLDALKKEADGKIMTLLTPEETAAWNAAQGEPMRFRKGLRGNRF